MADIKPLVWKWDEDDADGMLWEVRTPFGWINVQQSLDGVTWYWSAPTDAGFGYLTADAAKAGAQTWWEEIVSECLTRHPGDTR